MIEIRLDAVAAAIIVVGRDEARKLKHNCLYSIQWFANYLITAIQKESLDWLCHGIIIITIVHDYMKKMNCFFIYFSASLFVVFVVYCGNTSCHSPSWEKNIQIDALSDRFKTSLVHILNKLKRKECRFQIKFF